MWLNYRRSLQEPLKLLASIPLLVKDVARHDAKYSPKVDSALNMSDCVLVHAVDLHARYKLATRWHDIVCKITAILYPSMHVYHVEPLQDDSTHLSDDFVRYFDRTTFHMQLGVDIEPI